MYIADPGKNDIYSGKSGNDYIDGWDGNDTLRGDGGNDQLIGNVGDDKLIGGPGKDVLYGGVGKDILTGGSGNDTFLFYTDSLFSQGSDIDIVKDFTAGGKNRDFIAVVATLDNGESIDSYADLKGFMKDKGDDVHITFDSGDKLIIEDVDLKTLSAKNFTFEYEM